MDHPILKNIRIFIAYLLVWMLIAGIHSSVYYFFYGISLNFALFDAAVSSFSFAFLGLGLWYLVRYTDFNKNSVLYIVASGLASIVMVLAIWLLFQRMAYSAIKTDHPDWAAASQNLYTVKASLGIMYFLIVALSFFLYKYYINLQEKIKSENELKALVKETELSLLKSQLNPHFLFNSLNSISYLTISKPEKAREMIVKLSDFLRYALAQKKENIVSLDQEMENIKKYLEIEKVRFDDRLVIEFEIDDVCMHMKLPQLILQPLFENAIKHGVYESAEPVRINTKIACRGNALFITIENDIDREAKPRTGKGIGIFNIKSRLEIIYGVRNLLQTEKTSNKFTAKLTIPQQ